MGIFRRRKKENTVDKSEYRWLTVDEAIALSRGEKPVTEKEIISMLDEIRTRRKNTDRLKEETKFEYEAVIRHLADLQRFGSLSDRVRNEITDTAKMIINLEQQRASYQEGEKLISDDRYRTMEIYADEIPKQIRMMEERENYLMLVNNDLRKLEGEKGSIKYDRELSEKKKKFLTKFSYVVIITVITLFILFFVIADKTGKNMTLCFLVTGAAACVYAAYFAVSVTNCAKSVKKDDMLLARAVELTNSVKIKYVNATNALDYTYEKYNCNSHAELAYIWQQYGRAKEEEKKYKKNTQLLNACQTSLVELLGRNGFEIPDIWAHQAETLLNPGDMADLRDVLEARRRKLKAQLDYTIKQQNGINSEINSIRDKYPGHSALIERLAADIIGM